MLLGVLESVSRGCLVAGVDARPPGAAAASALRKESTSHLRPDGSTIQPKNIDRWGGYGVLKPTITPKTPMPIRIEGGMQALN